MSANPYQPPAETPLDPTGNDWNDIEPPRYSGRLRQIQGTVDQSDAIAMAKQCKSINVRPPDHRTAKPTNPWLLIVLSLALGLIVLFSLVDSAPASMLPLGVRSRWSATGLFFFAAILLTLLGLALCIYHLFRVRFDHCDPPLGGPIQMALEYKGCSIEKLTQDGRPITIYCSWRQLHVLESPDAWLLSAGTVNPFLIPKSLITDKEHLQDFNEHVANIATWQASQQPNLDLNTIPPEASESFPDYRSGARQLSISSVAELRARKRAAGKLRENLPKFRVTKRTPMYFAWSAFLIVFSTATLYLVLTIDWLNWRDHFIEIFVILPPIALVMGFGVYLTNWVRRETRIDAAISDEFLWYDYRSLLLKLRIDSFPFRRLVDDLLILATPQGETTVVFQRSDFLSPQDFDAVARQVTRMESGTEELSD